MTIDDIRQQVEEQIDFDRLEELNAQLEKDIRGILDSCGLYYRIFSRVKTKNSISKKQINTIKVALMLPFTSTSQDEQSRMVEFYEGFLMAIDSLKHQGVSAESFGEASDHL